MGTGKTRAAIDIAFDLEDVNRVLILCPKAVIPVWRTNLNKFASAPWDCWDTVVGTVNKKAESLKEWLKKAPKDKKIFIIMNYDIAWRMAGTLAQFHFQMMILDESHRVKAHNTKISRFVAREGRRIPHRLCLSGTPMAHSPLDVFGQYRFLDPTIYGTNWGNFLDQYAILGGPERRFIVGYKNQQELMHRFRMLAVSCRMSDVKERLNLPDALPDVLLKVQLPAKTLRMLHGLEQDMIATCADGTVVAKNVLVKLLRCLQMTSGFCVTQSHPAAPEEIVELNDAKAQMLISTLEDIGPTPVVVFAHFRHDLDTIAQACHRVGRACYELSGNTNQLERWQQAGGLTGAVLAVQIQAGAEGVDMTQANHAIYFSLPHSLALYNQSRARLYRPGQNRPVSFIHIIAENTIDEGMYLSLARKQDIIESIRNGSFDFGYAK
jgi:SNF2 family DNA or RNA helicase